MAKAVKSARGDKWIWMQSMVDKDKWSIMHIPDGELHAPYVKKSMSKNPDGSHSWYVYRNGRALGAPKTLEAAQKMCEGGKPDEAAAADARQMSKYIEDTPRDAEAFKKLSKLSQQTIADVYPWAMPSNRKLDEAGVKAKVLTKRTDLMNKHEKNATRSGKYNMDAVIKITKKGNPKREGTGQHMRWAIAIAHNGKTVREMFAAGGDKFGIQQMTEAGYMELVEK